MPSELLTAFNKALKKAGYSDRSKGMQVAIRTFLSENEWTGNGGFGAGTLVILYDPEVEGIESWTTKVQHDHGGLINASMHIHLNEHNCLEAIMVKGSVAEIKHLAKKLSEERGVKNLKVHFVKLV